jgi:predicted HTH transcriptional regulator
MSQREYQGISERAARLLDEQEDRHVDFKQSAAGMDTEDIVAFANTPSGGTILLGIEEAQKPDGRQYGRVIGCAVGDQERLSILSRAESCIPRIEVDVITENLGDTPFFRIEIASGPQKPYCTSRGTYKIRGDGANKPLTPRRLLGLFLDSESEEFLDRFRKATEELDSQMNHLLATMDLLTRVGRTLDSEDPTQAPGEQTHSISEVYAKLEERNGDSLTALQHKLDAIIAHLGIE